MALMWLWGGPGVPGSPGANRHGGMSLNESIIMEAPRPPSRRVNRSMWPKESSTGTVCG